MHSRQEDKHCFMKCVCRLCTHVSVFTRRMGVHTCALWGSCKMYYCGSPANRFPVEKKNGSSGMRSDLPKVRKLVGDGTDLNSCLRAPTPPHTLLTVCLASNHVTRHSPITRDFCSPSFGTARSNFLCIMERSLLFSSPLMLTMASLAD